MADNFPFTPGAGLTGASDDVGGVQYPRAKMVWGEDGVANDVAVAGGKALPVQHDTTGIGHGVKTVAAAGTDEALAGSTAAKWVTVQAQSDNTGLIAVGGAGVDATVATGTGLLLIPGDSFTFLVDNLADVFIDATVTGDGVRFMYGI